MKCRCSYGFLDSTLGLGPTGQTSFLDWENYAQQYLTLIFRERMAFTSVLAMFTNIIKSFIIPDKTVLIATGVQQISSNLAILEFESLNSIYPYVHAY